MRAIFSYFFTVCYLIEMFENTLRAIFKGVKSQCPSFFQKAIFKNSLDGMCDRYWYKVQKISVEQEKDKH